MTTSLASFTVNGFEYLWTLYFSENHTSGDLWRPLMNCSLKPLPLMSLSYWPVYQCFPGTSTSDVSTSSLQICLPNLPLGLWRLIWTPCLLPSFLASCHPMPLGRTFYLFPMLILCSLDLPSSISIAIAVINIHSLFTQSFSASTGATS